MRNLPLMTFVAVTALSAAVAAAAPSVVSSDLAVGTFAISSDNDGLANVSADFSFTTVSGQGSILLVGVAGEGTHWNSSFADLNVSGVWDTTGENLAGSLLTSYADDRESYILAFDLGDETGTTADVTLSFSTGYNGQGFGVSAVQIAGATMPPATQAASANEADLSLSFTAVPAGAVYFDVAAVNNSADSFSSTDGLTRDASATQSGFSAGMISSYAEGVSGDITAGYSTSVSDSVALSGVYVVPEPATMSLLALGGLVALRRRRR